MQFKKYYCFFLFLLILLFSFFILFPPKILWYTYQKAGCFSFCLKRNSVSLDTSSLNKYAQRASITSKLSVIPINFIRHVDRLSYKNDLKHPIYHGFLKSPNFAFSEDLPIVHGRVDVVAAQIESDLLGIRKVEESLTQFISQRYRMPYQPIRNLVKATFETGRLSGIDPLLLLAVMATESGFNSFAVSRAGAKGLMQVMSCVHSDKFEYFGGVSAVFEPYANMQVGTRILKDCLKKRRSLESGLHCYVGAKKANDGGYTKKVLHARKIFRAAAKKKSLTNKLPARKNKHKCRQL